jgi:cell division protein ZapA (FtsZ GTPase activity inhibitor)
MASGTTVQIYGKKYTFKAPESSVSLEQLADYVDSRMRELSASARAVPGDIAVLAALNIAQDLFELKQQVAALEAEQGETRQQVEERTAALAEKLETELQQMRENPGK